MSMPEGSERRPGPTIRIAKAGLRGSERDWRDGV